MRQIIYTDTDRVRSALGVDSKDLSDKQITDRDIEKELRLDLLSWIPTHGALYDEGQSDTATEVQVSIADALTLYSTYYCAVQVSRSMQLATPQKISDGKNALDRFANIDWKALQAYLSERMATYKAFLIDNTTTPTNPVVPNFFTGVGLATDPVKTAPG